MNGFRNLVVTGMAALFAVTATLLPALATSMAFYPADTRRIDVAAGAAVFESKCKSCHAISADGNGYGPSLHNIGRAAQTRKPGTSAADYLRESIVEPEKFRAPGSQGEMPKSFGRQLTAEQLLNVIAYLESQGGKIDYRELLALPPVSVQTASEEKTKLELASIERGRELFFGKLKCAACHAFDGQAGATLVAPNLEKAGMQSRDYLRDAVLHPSKQILPNYVQCRISVDGAVIQGRRLSQTDQTLRLLMTDREGRFFVSTYVLSDLEPLDEERVQEVVLPSTTSAMPEYSQTISPEELEAVLDFLQTLR